MSKRFRVYLPVATGKSNMKIKTLEWNPAATTTQNANHKGRRSMKAANAMHKTPIAAPWRMPDIGILMIRIGNSSTRNPKG